MPEFIKGLDLCEGFFQDHARDILEKSFPNLRYTAGLLGYGSDVLGYDDPVSTDHMWGPRFYLFLQEEDIHLRADILEALASKLPYTYHGYSVNFSAPDSSDGGVQHPEYITEGRVNPLVWIHTPGEFYKQYLGIIPESGLDWLTLSEHRLLAYTSGRLFVDMLGLEGHRQQLAFYPREVKLYLIASQWALISEEQAFVKRCGVCGDEIGSQINCARIAERLMRLCFLYHDRYAPYSKWFGKAFSALPISPEIKGEISWALAVRDVKDRENHLVTAQALVAELHNAAVLTPEISIEVQSYFGRDIKVIYADRIAAATQKQITNEALRNLPLFGTMSQIGNFVSLSDNPKNQPAIRALYGGL